MEGFTLCRRSLSAMGLYNAATAHPGSLCPVPSSLRNANTPYEAILNKRSPVTYADAPVTTRSLKRSKPPVKNHLKYKQDIMTKYNSLARQKPIKKVERPNPIWRGMGCLIIIIVPLISFAAAKVLIDYGIQQGWARPQELLGYPKLPEEIKDNQTLLFLLSPITRWPN